jgi:ribosome maturation factor RimP
VLRGLGTPSGSTIRFDLGGAYTKLVVWPILDDSSGPNVSCKARILVDGQLAWQGTIKSLTSPQAVTTNVAGKKELTLQVESAAGDVLTRFVWAWPVVTR